MLSAGFQNFFLRFFGLLLCFMLKNGRITNYDKEIKRRKTDKTTRKKMELLVSFLFFFEIFYKHALKKTL